MRAVVGVFRALSDAERAIDGLRRLGLGEDRLSLLTPRGTDRAGTAAMPTIESEPPGTGSALGAIVGGAVGAAAGMPLGAAMTLAIPALGPIVAVGLIGAALLGATGAAVGNALETSLRAGVPKDEAYVYLDALRQGRRVVVALADDDTQAAAVRAALLNSGAESLDAARERWWVGLRDVERQRYVAEGRDFEAAEPIFRQGFEAGLRLPEPGQSYGEAQGALRDLYPDVYDREEFRDGYERGVDYSLGMRERRDRAA